MSSSTPSHARSTRRRILGIRTRDAAIALTVLVGATSTVALQASADDTATDVQTAAVGDVRPLAEPIAMDGDALRVDAYEPVWAGAERPTQPGEAAAVSAVSASVEDFASRKEAEAAAAADRQAIWYRLADCESGEWDGNGRPIPGSATWDVRPGDHIFEGGLQFHPETWDGYAPAVLGADAPSAAYLATPAQQIAVAERVLDDQGWKAWPVCSRKLGYR